MKPRKPKHVLVIDAETFYDKDYSLSKMSTIDYIMDKRFQPICLAATRGSLTPSVVVGDGSPAPAVMREFLMDLGWEDALVVGHHNRFDAAICRFRLKLPQPAMYGCTRLMARVAVRPYTGQVDLRTVALHYRRGQKGEQRKTYLGYRLESFSAQALADYTGYCQKDVELTRAIFRDMRHELPFREMVNIDLTLRMYLYPRFVLDVPVLEQRLTRVIEEKQTLLDNLPLGFTREDLMSQKKLGELLPTLGVETPLKWSEKQEKFIPALAKTDPGFKAFLEHTDPRVQAVASARLGIKSTIEETRIQRLLDIGKRYRVLPVPLLYAGAHTYRYSGDEKINLQNLPRGSALRQAIKAPPGYVIIAADYSQIEARICAGLAKCTRLLEAFADPDRDPYCEAASQDYGRVITKADKIERFAGKTKILQLQYASGWEKLQATLERGGLKVTERTARTMMSNYRLGYWEIPELWKKLNACLPRMAMNQSFDIMPGLDVINGMLRLPNGMLMPYNELKLQGRGFIYRYGREWRRMYGGKLCLSEGTLVLTGSGWKPIEQVTALDWVHDGVEFVQHDGLANNGMRTCLPVDGVWMTPDHKVLTKEGWKDALAQPRPDRSILRLPAGYTTDTLGRQKAEMGISLHGMRRTVRESGYGCDGSRQEGRNSVLWLPQKSNDQRKNGCAWYVPAPGIRRLAKHVRPLRTVFASRMGELRRAWDSSMQSLAGIVSGILERHGQHLPAWVNAGTYRQQRPLRPEQLSLDTARRSGVEPTEQPTMEPAQGYGTDRTVTVDAVLPMETRPVYDLVNAGPRSRFVVLGNEGPMIVHNCENIVQALAGLLIREAMTRLYAKHGLRTALQLHDELVLVVKKSMVDKARELIEQEMLVAPSWLPNLPLEIEIGVGLNYRDAK